MISSFKDSLWQRTTCRKIYPPRPSCCCLTVLQTPAEVGTIMRKLESKRRKIIAWAFVI